MGWFDRFKKGPPSRPGEPSGAVVMDASTREFLTSTRPAPGEDDLDRLFLGATHMRLLADGVADGEALSREVLLESSNADELGQLRELLRFKATGFHCMCLGDLALEISGPEGRRAVIGLHHGASFRWDPVWKSDAALANPRGLAEFFASRGAPQMLEGQMQDEAHGTEAARAFAAWTASAPPAFPPLDQLANQLGELSEAGRALAAGSLKASFRTDEDAIRALLHWFGNGRGPWSGFPSCELIPEKLLKGYPTAALVRAMTSADLSESQLEGASRLFAGWQFWKGREAERDLVPSVLRQRLRAHVSASGDTDKIRRFEGAW